MACLDIHRERQALARSMRDIDSAVGRCVSSLCVLLEPSAAADPAPLLLAGSTTSS